MGAAPNLEGWSRPPGLMSREDDGAQTPPQASQSPQSPRPAPQASLPQESPSHGSPSHASSSLASPSHASSSQAPLLHASPHIPPVSGAEAWARPPGLPLCEELAAPSSTIESDPPILVPTRDARNKKNKIPKALVPVTAVVLPSTSAFPSDPRAVPPQALPQTLQQ